MLGKDLLGSGNNRIKNTEELFMFSLVKDI